MDLVDEFRKWECTHNRENYGRFDAFKAGHALGGSMELARLRAELAALKAERDALKTLRDSDARTFVAWVESHDRLKAELEAAKANQEILHSALTEIAEEPNRLGLMSDEVVEEYDVRAWSIAYEALAEFEAAKTPPPSDAPTPSAPAVDSETERKP